MRAAHLFVSLIAVVVLLGACRHSTTWVQSSISTAELGDVYVETVDGVAQVAIYRDGQLLGAEGIDREVDSIWWVNDLREIVDHPRLGEWRAKKAELDALVAGGQGQATEVIALLRALPFKRLVSERALGWVDGRPERAVVILDAIDTLSIQDEATAELVQIALAAPGLDGDRLASWAALEAVQESPEAFLVLARSPGAGSGALRALLEGLDELPYDERRPGFAAVGQRLAPDEAEAFLLVQQVEELPYDERTVAMLDLMQVPGASSELSVRVLDQIGEFSYQDRPALYLAAAPEVLDLPRARHLLLDRLDELAWDQRGLTILSLLSWSDGARLLSSALVAEIGDLPTDVRDLVLLAIIDGPGFVGPTQRACIVAAEDELYGEARQRVLLRIAEHPATEARYRELARHHLEE